MKRVADGRNEFWHDGFKKMGGRYGFDLLFKHSNELANSTRRELKSSITETRRAFAFLDRHFSALEKTPKRHARNVKMALTARFIYNMFAGLLLIERGLVLDAFNSRRSGIEATARHSKGDAQRHHAIRREIRAI